MSKVRVHNFTISLDGYCAGPNQGLDQPLGVGGESLHEWFLPTRTFRRMIGADDGTTGVDNDFAARAMTEAGVGAFILGRNMFGPIRGEWPDESWRGWWGDNPPYHAPVFVLTHYPRPSLTMEGGTTFHFVTDGAEVALAKAKDAAQGLDVQVGGGAATVRQYLRAGLIDEMHVVIAQILLGSGEHLFSGIDLPALGYTCTQHVTTPNATHVVIAKGSH